MISKNNMQQADVIQHGREGGVWRWLQKKDPHEEISRLRPSAGSKAIIFKDRNKACGARMGWIKL